MVVTRTSKYAVTYATRTMWQPSLLSPFSTRRPDKRRQFAVLDSANDVSFTSTHTMASTTRRPNSRRRRALKPLSAAAILVASFLVVHTPGSVQAAPSPLHASASSTSSRSLVNSFSARQGKGIVSSLDRPIVGDEATRSVDDVDDDLGYFSGEHHQGGIGIIGRGGIADVSSLDTRRNQLYRQQSSPTRSRSFNEKRSLSSYAVSGANHSIAAASITSSLANAWDPGRRSVWFQRKAVIITSIFLAIFIVLIIGATVFLRDKRDEDMDEEYDVSDEAALARMREEREMRLGSRGEKKSGRFGRKKDSSSSTRSNDIDGASTAIVASKWARLPTRKIRMRKRKSRDSSLTEKNETTVTTSTPAATDDNGNSQNDHSPSSGSDSHDTSLARQISASTPGTQELPPPLTPRETHATLGDSGSASPHPSRAARAPLDVADVEFAEEEEERMRMSDALPPAYIPAHRRRSVQHDAAGAGASLHPSAARLLAGQQGTHGAMEARGDEKRALVEATSGEDVGLSGVAGMSASTSMGTSGGSSYPAAHNNLDAHIATDDKSLLSRMRLAASQPADSPSYDQTVSSAALSLRPMSSVLDAAATAPALESEAISHEHVADPSDVQAAHAVKGKNASRPSGSVLPAPPAPHVSVAFSRFDMPYLHQGTENDALREQRASPKSSSVATSSANEKQREAEEEARRALSVMASNPDDLPTTLPRYERDEGGAAPSAPHLDDTHDAEGRPSVDHDDAARSSPSSPSSASAIVPSAPFDTLQTPSAATVEASAASAPSLDEEDS